MAMSIAIVFKLLVNVNFPFNSSKNTNLIAFFVNLIDIFGQLNRPESLFNGNFNVNFFQTLISMAISMSIIFRP